MGRLGLQLYTVKEDAARDFLGTVRAVGRMGYDGIEFAGFYDTSAGRVKAALEEAGLAAAGAVHPLHELQADLDAVIAYNREIGSPAVVFPWLDAPLRQSSDDWKHAGDLFNGFGERCRRDDLLFLYHIHGYEFERFDGTTGLDLLVLHTDPALVGLELDTYWVEHGGADAVQTFREYAGRVR